ncbi:MAG: hypothetical protein ACREHD_04075 [Pirellulales bacterium]
MIEIMPIAELIYLFVDMAAQVIEQGNVQGLIAVTGINCGRV